MEGYMSDSVSKSKLESQPLSATLRMLKDMMSSGKQQEAETLLDIALGIEVENESQSYAVEDTLRSTRTLILSIGFAFVILVSLILVAMKYTRTKSMPAKLIMSVFMLTSAAVLYLAAIVPQIQLFQKVKSRATDGVMTSFLTLAMVAVIMGLVSRGFSLKTAIATQKGNDKSEMIIALMGMSVPVIPFVLHVYMIRQISLYNSDHNPTTAASKKLAHTAWYSLLVAYAVVWSLAIGLGWHFGKKIRGRSSSRGGSKPGAGAGAGAAPHHSPLRSRNRMF